MKLYSGSSPGTGTRLSRLMKEEGPMVWAVASADG